jgi:hypothetical protein
VTGDARPAHPVRPPDRRLTLTARDRSDPPGGIGPMARAEHAGCRSCVESRPTGEAGKTEHDRAHHAAHVEASR